MDNRRSTRTGVAAGLLAALTLAGAAPALADDAVVVPVAPDGTVHTDPDFSGPQVTEIRVINEGRFLEIYWDRYVEEEAAVSPEYITLHNGERQIELTAKPATGRTSTIFFDRANKQIAATDANSMARLPQDLHLSSIAYLGTIDPAQPLTVAIAGEHLVDEDGNPAKDALYTDVPQLDYYTQKITTEHGIVVKANDRVDPDTLTAAAAQVEVQLARTETGIAAQMADYGCSLAVYGARENAYLVPEHRGGYDPAAYDVEGFGGSTHNNCVSSVSERNVLRTRGNPDPDLNTAYPNENILIHEFGHAVRLVGIETMADPTLSDELYRVYENAYYTGLWPNTYAMSNIDEYFATLSTVWFDVMAEAPSWDDGVRSPINTRDELREYDPQAYDFFATIYPADLTLPAPWDEPAPDEHTGDYRQLPELPHRETARDLDLDSDLIRITTDTLGGVHQIDRFACDPDHPERDICLWFQWGDGVWTVAYEDGYYTISASDGSGVLTAISDSEVGYRGMAADSDDPAQRWRFVPDHSTPQPIYDGALVNAANGRALTVDGRAATNVSLNLTDPASATRWMLESTVATAAQGTAAFLLPVQVEFSTGAQQVRADVLQQMFTLPQITDVGGADWSRPDQEFLGWRLVSTLEADDLLESEEPGVGLAQSEAEVLPADWGIPDGTVAVSLEAVWAEDDGGTGDGDDGTGGEGPGDDGDGGDDDSGDDGAAGDDDAAGGGTGSDDTTGGDPAGDADSAVGAGAAVADASADVERIPTTGTGSAVLIGAALTLIGAGLVLRIRRSVFMRPVR